MPPAARCVLVSAGGEYADPWHPFEATSAVLAQLLAPLVERVEVRTDVEAALADLVRPADLLVLNLGDAGPGAPGDAARAGLLAHATAGRPVLAMHSSTTAYPDWAEWEVLLGGRWVRDITFHPPYGPARIAVDRAHPVVAGLGDFATWDERYSRLRVAPGVELLAWHELEGERHPLAWLHRHGPAPTAYIALGHDPDAYAADGTRTLVVRAAQALLSERG